MAALKKSTMLLIPAALVFLTGVAGPVFSAPSRQGAIELEEGLFIGFLWPLRGETSSPWGQRADPISPDIVRHHAGLDIAAPEGTWVTASRAGRVESVGSGGNYGNFVVLRHANDISTLYGHLGSIRVRKGAFVRPGQVLGTVGSTGRSTGYHLHFEIRVGKKSVDPMKWLVPPGYMMPLREMPADFDTPSPDRRR